MLKLFLKDESGTVTADYVVLAGAVIAIAVGVVAVVESAVSGTADNVNTSVLAEIQLNGGSNAAEPWEPIALHGDSLQGYRDWMGNFEDDQLIAHMNNQEQYKDVEAGAGHPYETYRDEYYVARDEATSRGLL
ncbi:hypothetical protein [Pontivivens insulae]|uniref:Uncharacterized protein n=1 Tax=Pontivivens insulae TaxID=1639689 RepID=A0A2R8AF17_9RHOB|nr:hypothetical protein [Pontivivens insulae]RED11909.1 Flp pilus assembly pilin Flp [Pontivivens insulae]SPF30665.1 hypothetical protein POI8812_03007 [Pontivivens insulae]